LRLSIRLRETRAARDPQRQKQQSTQRWFLPFDVPNAPLVAEDDFDPLQISTLAGERKQ